MACVTVPKEDQISIRGQCECVCVHVCVCHRYRSSSRRSLLSSGWSPQHIGHMTQLENSLKEKHEYQSDSVTNCVDHISNRMTK